jgi:hypothetical protein
MAAEAVKGELESEKLVVTHCGGQGEGNGADPMEMR